MRHCFFSEFQFSFIKSTKQLSLKFGFWLASTQQNLHCENFHSAALNLQHPWWIKISQYQGFIVEIIHLHFQKTSQRIFLSFHSYSLRKKEQNFTNKMEISILWKFSSLLHRSWFSRKWEVGKFSRRKNLRFQRKKLSKKALRKNAISLKIEENEEKNLELHEKFIFMKMKIFPCFHV